MPLTETNQNGKGVNFTNATNFVNTASSELSQGPHPIAKGVGKGATIGGSIGMLTGNPLIGLAGAGIGSLIGAIGGIFRNRKNKKAQKDAQEKADAERDLQYQRQLDVMNKQQAMQQEYYDKNFSYKSQVQQMKDSGLSVASMYQTGTQGVGSSSVSAPSVQSGKVVDPYYSVTGTLADSMPQPPSNNDIISLLTLALSEKKAEAEVRNVDEDTKSKSIDNITREAENLAKIAEIQAHIKALEQAGKLSAAQANEINKLLNDKQKLIESETRSNNASASVSEEHAKNVTALDESQILLNKANTDLSAQNTELSQYRSYNESLTYSKDKDKYLISKDICRSVGVDVKNAPFVESLLDNASKSAGVNLAETSIETIFSWFNFDNWKHIISSKNHDEAMKKMQDEMLKSKEEQQRNEHEFQLYQSQLDRTFRSEERRNFAENAVSGIAQREIEQGRADYMYLTAERKKQVDDYAQKLYKDGFDNDKLWRVALYASKLYENQRGNNSHKR